jgi:CRISPR/Cas system CSM-associated protein Csm3 (group 7 of RAMP superfamily)
MSARWNDYRRITRRILIQGRLTLLTPARFGSGETSVVTDMPILRDARTRAPLLTGSSIAGALRAYLRERLIGYEKQEPQDASLLSQKLFGAIVEARDNGQSESRESYLTIDDSVAEAASTEFRPGVKIDPATRISAYEDGKGGQLYDMELLEAGTSFDLHLELDLPEPEEQQKDLLFGLAVALSGFESQEIGLGARKRRGFGECRVDGWTVEIYDLKDPLELVNWIQGRPGTRAKGSTIAELLGVSGPLPDRRSLFRLKANFKIATSMLIRSGSGQAEAPDMVHLRSKRGSEDKPILSGTSLAGAMRARGLRIANTLIADPVQAGKLVAGIFGPDELKKQSERRKDEAPFASRLLVREGEIEGRGDLVQSRIRIDRFTGGTFPGALFEQQPVIGGSRSGVEMSIELRNPQGAQIGLLLQILKDLWLGDLPLGGESSAGRGRLAGTRADLYWHQPDREPEEWHITSGENGRLQVEGDPGRLDTFASDLRGVR